jgi:UDP-glucose/GDP-mannose dehydrogenase family, central domain
MKIGIIGNGFVGRATQIFAKNYYRDGDGDGDGDNVERYEVLPNTATTPAKPKSVYSWSATAPVSSSTAPSSAPDAPSWGGETPAPFFKRVYFKPIEVYIYDIRPGLCQPLGVSLEDLDRECDLLFFCLPTPLNHDGSCYTRILEEALGRCRTNPYKIIRSTIPVGFAAKHGCYFMPEFLTEANWEDDFRRMKEWVVGIPCTATAAAVEEFKTRIQKLIKRSHKNRAIMSPSVVFCSTNEAEMLKLMKNCFLSAKVGLMNEFYDFSQATNTNFNTVVTLAKLDQRIGTTHFSVPGPDGRRGFGGTCFPKDTHSLYCQMNAHGVRPHIYPAILTRNDTIDRPEREWAKDVWRTTVPLPTPTSKVVVVFNDTASITPSSSSLYLAHIIRTNLAKNNVVIEVSRERVERKSTHSLSANHIVKHHIDMHAPLFFPRVDECYYVPHSTHTAYETMQEVACVIDLWNQHQEMTLYVIKQSRVNADDHDNDHDNKCRGDDESGTEGFESEHDDMSSTPPSPSLDYAKIIEEYYHTNYDSTNMNNRRLIVMF